jgi:NDP-sugar pyrophosphorylase family protein
MPVGDYPILEIILRQLKRAGADQVILAVGHMSQMFRAFFGDGSALGIPMSYSLEAQALGTAGPIALALEQLRENFLVMNGDLLTTFPYRQLYDDHCASGASATIAIYSRDVKIDFGVVETESGNLARYREKPTLHFDVSMGINILNKKDVSPYLSPGRYLDIPDLMMKLRYDGKLVRCFRAPCEWLDIGRIDDYESATEIFQSRKSEFLPDCPE